MNKNKINSNNILFVDIQLVSTIVTIILLVWYIFDNRVLVFFELFLGLSMISMAINNHLIYKRKNNTIIYAVIGILILIIDLLMILGV